MKVLYLLQLRLLVTRTRALGIGALGLLGVLLALAARSATDPADASFRFIRSYGLAGLIPIASLVLASASLGDPAEDGTLVHLWLRPIRRSHLAFASWLAALTVTVPFAVVPMTLAAAVCGVGGDFIIGTFVASLLGAAAYGAVFVWFGLRVQRALPWGLAYVLIWEGAIAGTGIGLSRVSIRGYTQSVLRTFYDGGPVVKFAVSGIVATIVLAALTVGGVTLTARRLDRTDIA
jgi:ABC-2 type transport system permease protein